ncbi:MAG: hypothetical protein BGO53_08875 [Sphingobacteriales bacterium 39-19]|nr:MAG: hypothetical protein BGO53_08875 [Sphingobacteriales bacterium 39-19]
MGAYDNVNLNKRLNTAPGIAQFALIAKKSDFETISGIAVPTEATPLADTVKIKTAHTFKAGKAWAKWSLAKDKNQMEANAEGDPSFRQLKQVATVFVPGSYDLAHATMAALLNEDLIVLVKDANCGANMYYQLGNECSAATINPKFTSSTTASGVKGYEVQVEYSGPCIQIYDAEIGTTLADEEGAAIELTYATGTVSTQSGVTGTVPASDPDVKFEFTSISGPYTTTKTMIIKVGASTEITVVFAVGYAGKAFTFTDAAGIAHAGNFVEATVTFA